MIKNILINIKVMLLSPKTPMKLKVYIISSLAYAIFPADIIPDFIPVVGLADDLGLLYLAIRTFYNGITPEIEEEFKRLGHTKYIQAPPKRRVP